MLNRWYVMYNRPVLQIVWDNYLVSIAIVGVSRVTDCSAKYPFILSQGLIVWNSFAAAQKA